MAISAWMTPIYLKPNTCKPAVVAQGKFLSFFLIVLELGVYYSVAILGSYHLLTWEPSCSMGWQGL